MAEMDTSDFFSVITSSFGTVLSDDTIQRMISVNSMIARHMVEDRQFAAKGSPFEFNLRDLLRWAQLTVEVRPFFFGGGGHFPIFCEIL